MKTAILLLAAVIAAPAAAVTYNPLLDFSSASNPNGVYTYGYETSFGGALTAFTSNVPVNSQPQAWTTPAINQYLGVYDTGSSILQHPGPSGQYSIVRITVATAGSYVVSGLFSSSEDASTDVHILANGSSLFDGAVNGSSGYAFGFTHYFASGATLDFAVGDGGNGYIGDSTLLGATVTSVPEPASWALLVTGFVMVGATARRRHRSRPLAA